MADVHLPDGSLVYDMDCMVETQQDSSQGFLQLVMQGVGVDGQMINGAYGFPSEEKCIGSKLMPLCRRRCKTEFGLEKVE